MVTLETMSLEQIGVVLSNIDVASESQRNYFDQACETLASRFDGGLESANALLDYHVTVFKKNASASRWSQLFAMMALVQYLQIKER